MSGKQVVNGGSYGHSKSAYDWLVDVVNMPEFEKAVAQWGSSAMTLIALLRDQISE